MTLDQKKIYADMIGMLSKLGLKTQNTLKDSVQKYTSDPARDQERYTMPGYSLNTDDTARKLRVRKLMGD
jgi:hypothetical protein